MTQEPLVIRKHPAYVHTSYRYRHTEHGAEGNDVFYINNTEESWVNNGSMRYLKRSGRWAKKLDYEDYFETEEGARAFCKQCWLKEQKWLKYCPAELKALDKEEFSEPRPTRQRSRSKQPS
jgi:hypothetical protein